MDQWNSKESPEINPTLYGQLIFDKVGSRIEWSKKGLFNKWCWESWTDTCKKNETWLPTYNIHKNKFQVDRRLKYKLWHHKVLQENLGRKNSDIPCSNSFTDKSPKARDIKESMNKWDLIKIKSFCTAKENSIKMKREPTIWENKIANDTSPLETSVWSQKYIKNSHNSTLRRQATQLKNGRRTWTDTSLRRTYRGPRDYERILSITNHHRDAN